MMRRMGAWGPELRKAVGSRRGRCHGCLGFGAAELSGRAELGVVGVRKLLDSFDLACEGCGGAAFSLVST